MKPNKGCWFVIERLTASLAGKNALPKEVNDWLQALRARKEHPAWAEARRSLNEGLPVKGRVIGQKGSNAHIIELENGLHALCSIYRNTPKLTKKDTYDFYVLQIDLDKDTIQVGLKKRVQFITGAKYYGFVRDYKEYGVFVTINGQQGLLHKTQCSNWDNLVKKFPKGNQIYVEVLEVTSRGPKLRYVGSDLAEEVTIEDLTVSEVYKA